MRINLKHWPAKLRLPKYNMQKLQLTLWTSRPRWPVKDFLILAFGILLALGVGVNYALNAHDLSKLQAILKRQLSMQTSARVADPAETQALQQLSAQWAFPWGSLFGALENAKTENVILLALTPDTTTKTVVIEAQTEDVYAMLNYVTSLKKQDKLRNVNLSRHEQEQDSVNQPVKFSVSAEWVE
jgi:hypothetical protein